MLETPSALRGRGRPRADRPRPFEAAELAMAVRLSRRLQDALRALLRTLPAEQRTASALARRLSVDRATCHRAVSAAAQPNADASLLGRVPGVRGLRLLVRAFEREGADAATIADGDAAIDQLDEFLRSIGGSQARLVERLRVASGAPALDGASSRRREREALFHAAAALTGRWSDVTVTVFGYRPAPGDPSRMESFGVSALVGHVARPDAVPLTFHWGSRASADGEPRTFTALDDTRARGRTPSVVLEPFTTRPVPLVTSSGPDGMLVQAVDPRAASKRPIDVAVATRPEGTLPHPAQEDPSIQEAWSLQHFPSRRLVFDVLVHRDLARQSIASADLHLWRPGFERQVGQRWTTRFPVAPRLEVLGPGLAGLETDAWARHAEMVRHVLRELGWPADEMVGYRVSEPYPVWRAGACITLDFGPGAGPAG